MTQKVKRWTDNDIKTLFETIKQYPDNKQVAFEKVSTKLNRSFHGVSFKYYKLYKAGQTGTITGSVESGFSHKKNTKRKNGIFKRAEELSPALVIVQQFLLLDKKNKDAVLTFLNTVS